MSSKDDCSILILSCDKNKDVLNIFLKNFKKYWGDCPYPIYIGLEKEKQENDEEKTFIYSDKKNWANRVKDYLKSIQSKYVLLILDDFLIEKKVENGVIEKYLNYMQQDVDCVNITLVNIDDKNTPVGVLGLEKRKNTGKFILNLQIGIWEKSCLYNLLKDKENPWETEIYGSIRARKYKEKSFYCLNSDDNMPIVYGRGWLVIRGSWNENELRRLDIYNQIDTNSGRDIKQWNRGDVLIPRRKRIVEIIGVRIRKIFSWINIYI